MKFYVLGPLAVTDGGIDLTPRAPKLQRLLGLLLMRHDQVVNVGELVDELWGERPPASAGSTLQTYVYKLRKALFGRAGSGQRSTLETRPNGYRLIVPPSDLDLCRYEELAEEGGNRLAAGDARGAAEVLDRAVSMWRGRPLAGMSTGGPLSVHVTRLEESRLNTIERRVEASLRLGRHSELIDELQELVAKNPWHEGLAARLLQALHMSGRSTEVVATYRRLRKAFTEDLGLEPSPYLQRVYRCLRSPTGQHRPPASASAPRPACPTLRLPPDVPELVGRDDIVDSLERVLSERPGDGGATRIVSISGVPGVGKTALAIRLAHRLRRRFRGGVHFVAVGGSEEHPARPLDVLERLMSSLGVPEGDRPRDLADASAAFRTWIAGRNALIVIDDAQDAEQTRLFLPGCPESAVIVTSRRGMYGLAGAHVTELDTLNLADGVRLLALLIGGRRVEEDPTGAERIVRLCEHLPLAIRGVAARLLAAPHLPLSKCADQLARAPRRLAELSFGDVDVRSRFDAGYRRLGEAEREALRQLGRARMTGFTAPRVSRLLGWSVHATEKAMARLVEHRFVRVGGRDPNGELHYTFAPLSHAYVWECVMAEHERI